MLSGRVAVVTGAAQGIGLATIQLLLKSGAKVGAIDVNETVLENTCTSLGNQYRNEDVLCLPCDVTNQNKLREVFQRAKDHYGSLDIVVNNAGIGDEDRWEKMIDINLTAVVSGTYLAREIYSMERGCVVVNVSSMAGLYPGATAPVYTATKHGVIGFTRSLKYLGQSSNFRVNCICPFFADTDLARPMIELLQKMKPDLMKNGTVSLDTIAKGIVQLITDESKAGAVLRATPRGLTYQVYPEEKAEATAKAKL